MPNLSPAEISAYGAFVLAVLVPIGNYILNRYKTRSAMDVKEFDDNVEIRKELRKEVERLSIIIQQKDDQHRKELYEKDLIIEKLNSEKYTCGVDLATSRESLRVALEKIKEFKETVIVQGNKVIEDIKNNQITNE